MSTGNLDLTSACANCCVKFELESEVLSPKCTKVTMAVPLDPANGSGLDIGILQAFQLMEVSVRDVFHEIFGLLFLESDQITLCSPCMNSLGNLYLAYKNLVATRQEHSILQQSINKLIEIVKQAMEPPPISPIILRTKELPNRCPPAHQPGLVVSSKKPSAQILNKVSDVSLQETPVEVKSESEEGCTTDEEYTLSTGQSWSNEEESEDEHGRQPTIASRDDSDPVAKACSNPMRSKTPPVPVVEALMCSSVPQTRPSSPPGQIPARRSLRLKRTYGETSMYHSQKRSVSPEEQKTVSVPLITKSVSKASATPPKNPRTERMPPLPTSTPQPGPSRHNLSIEATPNSPPEPPKLLVSQNVSKLPAGLPQPRAGTIFSVQATYEPRYKIPKTGPPYECPECPKILHNANTYKSHMYFKHMLSPPEKLPKPPKPKYFTCSYCNFEFTTYALLRKHRHEAHESEDAQSIDKWIAVRTGFGNRLVTVKVNLEDGDCKYFGCNFTATTKQAAIDHYIATHSRCEKDIEQANQVGIGVLQITISEREFQKLNEEGFWDQGTRVPKKPRPIISCDFCKFKIRSPMKLQRHIKKNHPEEYKPTQLLHTGLKQQEPDKMNKRTLKKNEPNCFSIVFPKVTLNFKLEDTTCPYCPKTFASGLWSSLRVHMRDKHLYLLNDNTHTCKKCEMAFNTLTAAKAHKRRCGKPDIIPTKRLPQPKLFKCEKCGRSVTTKENLEIHQATSLCSRSFSCEICGQTFRTNGNLIGHMVKHATERPYFCETCGRNYKCIAALKFHQKISHTEEGRLQYNEMMRQKNRRRKLAKQRQTQSDGVGVKPQCQNTTT